MDNNAALLERLQKMEADNAALLERLQKVEADNAALLERLQKVEADNAALEADNAALLERLQKVEADNSALEADNAALLERLQKVEADNAVKLAEVSEEINKLNEFVKEQQRFNRNFKAFAKNLTGLPDFHQYTKVLPQMTKELLAEKIAAKKRALHNKWIKHSIFWLSSLIICLVILLIWEFSGSFKSPSTIVGSVAAVSVLHGAIVYLSKAVIVDRGLVGVEVSAADSLKRLEEESGPRAAALESFLCKAVEIYEKQAPNCPPPYHPNN